jgi:hypothetical protein
MKRKLQMALVLAFACCMATAASGISYAAAPGIREIHAEDQVQPKYINTAIISADMYLDGSTAKCYSSVTAKRVCHISVNMELQRKVGDTWKMKASWRDSVDSLTLTMTRSFGLTERGTYRVKAYFNVAGEELSYTSVKYTY